MFSTKQSVLKNRASKILNSLKEKKKKELGMRIVSSKVEAGSGSVPEKKIHSIALSFEPISMTVSELAYLFRTGSKPVVGYISNEKFYIDLKAILPKQINKLIKAIEII